MTRRLLHQRESSSALWNSSQGPVSDVWGEELEKSNSSRALSHAESCLLSKAALCWITGRRPLWFPHREEYSGGDNWRFLNWQSLSDLHEAPAPVARPAPAQPSSIRELCSSQNAAGSCFCSDLTQHSPGLGAPVDQSCKCRCQQEWNHHKHLTDISELVSPFLRDISHQVLSCAVRAPDVCSPRAVGAAPCSQWEMLLLLFHRVGQWTEPPQTVNAQTELTAHQYLWFIN